MTVRELLAALAATGCPARAEGHELIFDSEPPHRFLPYIALLQTGLRAVLMGKRWYGIDAKGHGCGPGFDRSLNPAEQIPEACVLMTVEGDQPVGNHSGWDRISTRLRTQAADAFQVPDPKPKEKRAETKV